MWISAIVDMKSAIKLLARAKKRKEIRKIVMRPIQYLPISHGKFTSQV
jgi:hypothetical protein